MSFLFKPIKQKKEIMLLNPTDHRYTPLTVDRELEKLIYCKKHEGVQPIIFKLGPGWTHKDTRFLAVEGNPLVSFVKPEEDGGGVVSMGFEEYLRLIWGENAVNKLPPALKKSIEENAVGVTVTVEPYIPTEDTQKAFDDLKANSMLYDADLENLAKMGEAKEVKRLQDKIMDKIPWVLAGIGLTYILQGMGVIRGL